MHDRETSTGPSAAIPAGGATTVVSGGSRGLGLAVVRRLLARGDRVATFSRSGSRELQTLLDAHPGRLFHRPVDAADPRAVRRFVAEAAHAFGTIDHCVANAAIAAEGVLATMTDDDIDAMLTVNLRGSIVLVRECVRHFLARPRPTEGEGRASGHGTVVVVSSIVADRGSPGLAVYAEIGRAHV